MPCHRTGYNWHNILTPATQIHWNREKRKRKTNKKINKRKKRLKKTEKRNKTTRIKIIYRRFIAPNTKKYYTAANHCQTMHTVQPNYVPSFRAKKNKTPPFKIQTIHNHGGNESAPHVAKHKTMGETQSQLTRKPCRRVRWVRGSRWWAPWVFPLWWCTPWAWSPPVDKQKQKKIQPGGRTRQILKTCELHGY